MIVKEEEWILRNMEMLGIKPGETIKLLKKDEDKFIVQINDKMNEITKTLADQVVVNV
jgi:FeoA domain.